MNQDPDYEMILTVAWSAAYNPYYMIYGQNNPIPANAYVYPDLPPDPKRKRAANIGIALNSGSTRSVHQVNKIREANGGLQSENDLLTTSIFLHDINL